MASVQEGGGGGAGPVCLPRRAETFGGFDSHQMHSSKSKCAALDICWCLFPLRFIFFFFFFLNIVQCSAVKHAEPPPACQDNCTDLVTGLQMCNNTAESQSTVFKSGIFHFSS